MYSIYRFVYIYFFYYSSSEFIFYSRFDEETITSVMRDYGRKNRFIIDILELEGSNPRWTFNFFVNAFKKFFVSDAMMYLDNEDLEDLYNDLLTILSCLNKNWDPIRLNDSYEESIQLTKEKGHEFIDFIKRVICDDDYVNELANKIIITAMIIINKDQRESIFHLYPIQENQGEHIR